MTTEATTIRQLETVNTTVASSVFNALRSVWTAAGKCTERRRAEHAQQEMDPRLLRDIGINRSQIMSAVYTGSVKHRWSNGSL
jgi:uncharacterized protein YjiS (DUF1127 family)